MRNLLSNVMLVLPNVTMEPSNVRKREGDHQIWQKYNHMWCWYYTMWGRHRQMWEKKLKYNQIWEKYGQMWCWSNVTIIVLRTGSDREVRQWKPGTRMKIGFLSIKNRAYVAIPWTLKLGLDRTNRWQEPCGPTP